MKEYIKLVAVALIGGLVAGLVVGWLVRNQPSPLGTRFPNSGIAVGTTTQAGTGDIIVEDEARLGDLPVQGIRLDLASGVRIATWQNTTGATAYVPFADAGFTGGTASSSFDIALFATSSAASVIQALDFRELNDNYNINGFLIRTTYATSSGATTTNSVMAVLDRQGNGIVAVPNNGYIHFFLQDGDANCLGYGTGACETATSTNRGMTGLFAHFLYYR